MIARKKIRSLLTVAVVLLFLAALLPWVASRAQESPSTPQAEAVTDTVRFGSDLRAGEKPVQLVGQYAWTSINGQVVESAYSTEPQPMETGGDACVFGGAGVGCREPGDVASASTENGTMEPLAESRRLLGLIGLVFAGAQVAEPFATGARCVVGPDGAATGYAQQPTGEVRYGGAGLLGGLPDESINLAEVDNGISFTDDVGVGVLLNLLFALNVEVQIESNWGWDETNLRAYSEVTVNYLIRGSGDLLDQDSFTARSECGIHMSDGRGSTEPAGMGNSTQAAPFALERGPSGPTPTSVPGAPQAGGFSEEGFLEVDGHPFRYHLLSTRGLDAADRRVVGDILGDITEPDAGVEGTRGGARWQLFSAGNAGEQIPVLEIRLADGAVVQARPDLPGVRLPSPDRMDVTTPSSPAAPPEPSTSPESPSTPVPPTTDIVPAPPVTTVRPTETAPVVPPTTPAPTAVVESTETIRESIDD